MQGSYQQVTLKEGTTWRGRYSYLDPATGRRVHRRVHAPTKKACQAKVRDALTTLDAGETPRDETLTVAAFLARWLDAHAANIRPTTERRYRNIAKNHLLPNLGATPLVKLTTPDVQAHLGRLLTGGVPAPTVAYAHTVLRTALGEAVRWGLVDRNVASGAKSPRVVVREFPTWSAAEVARVLAVGDRGDLAAFWRIALLCGLRRGELIGLWWEDIDLERGTLAVRRTMQKTKTGWKLGPPKTKKGKRSLALPRSCIVALTSHRDRQAFERQRCGDAWHDSAFVFTNRTGGPLHVNTVIDAFERLTVTAGVPTIRFHDMRHTCATLLLIEGVHPKIVSEMLGHSTVQQTLDVYSHVLHGLQRSVADVLDGAILAAAEPVRVTSASPAG